jgi:hypothetical protein
MYMAECCLGIVGLMMDQYKKAQNTAPKSDTKSVTSRVAIRRTGLARTSVHFAVSRDVCAVVAMAS